MAYDKKKICLLYEEYISTEDDKVFGELMKEIDPIIDIVLTKYGKLGRYFEDARQEMRMKLWMHFRNPERLVKYSDNPSTYLFSVVRAYMVKIFESLKRIYGEGMGTIMDMGEGKRLSIKTGLVVEKKYILDTITKDFISQVAKRIERGNNFRKSEVKIQEMVIEEYQNRINFDLERLKLS